MLPTRDTADARCTVVADTDIWYETLKQITYLTTQITMSTFKKIIHKKLKKMNKNRVGGTIGAYSQQTQRDKNVF